MKSTDIPELNYLISMVEKRFGRSISTSNDFEALSIVIEYETHDHISASTLKRLWGYVTSNPTPRVSTLDILARFVGFKDFKAFCREICSTDGMESSYFLSECLMAEDLAPGDMVVVGWNPNRIIKLLHLGGTRFRVEDKGKSRLEQNDEFDCVSFLLGSPLYISNIIRSGTPIGAYVAGSAKGLTQIRVIKAQ